MKIEQCQFSSRSMISMPQHLQVLVLPWKFSGADPIAIGCNFINARRWLSCFYINPQHSLQFFQTKHPLILQATNYYIATC